MFKLFALARRVKDLVLDICRINFLIRILLWEYTWGSVQKRGHTLVADERDAQTLHVHVPGKMGWFLISHNTDDFQLICCHIVSVLSSIGWPGLFIFRSHTFHWLDLDLHQDSGVWIFVNCHHHANKLPRRWCLVVSGERVHLSGSITAYDSYHCFRGAELNRLEVHPSRDY